MALPVTVTVGGLATADADGVSISQTAVGAQYLVISGALADESANNICASQSPGGAGDLTIDGAAAVSGVAYLPAQRRVYITSAGNDSGRTFTIYGRMRVPQGGYVSVVETVTGANTNVVSTSKVYDVVDRVAISGASAGAVTVGMAGIGTLDSARRIIMTSGGNDTGITFTVYGTDWYGMPITDVVTGASGAAASSVLSFKTVTGVLTSGAVASTITVGTNGVADSPWVGFDGLAANAQVSVIASVTGTVNYDVEVSNDRPNTPGAYAYENPYLMTWLDTLDTELVNETASKNGFITIAPIWARVTLNSGTGTVRTTFQQAGLW